MASATLERPRRSAPSLRAVAAHWELGALALLVLAAVAGFLAFPTYPVYDSLYSLLWGRELLDGALPSYEVYRAPTPHPLANVLGLVLAPLGHGAERTWIALCVAAFVALVAGVHVLARTAFTPLVGLVAALLLVTRFDFAFYAARGYLDVGYLALVVWAAVRELRRDGRPEGRGTVLLLLGLAGLLRPEAWLLAGLYWLWATRGTPWLGRERLRLGALAAAAPVLWTLSDLVITGDPLYSLTYTSAFAEELGRSRGAEAIPAAVVSFLVKLDKLPVLLGGVAGLALAVALVPRRTAMPLALLAAGVGTFALIGAAGFSVIDRYLLVPSLMVMVFCAVALAGWTMLAPGRMRRGWAAGAGALVAVGAAFTLTQVDLDRLTSELAFRGDAHAALHDVLADPAVRAGLACGPVSVPSHKLVPDVRWMLGRGEGDVVARSAAATGTPVPERGVALLVHGRTAVLRQALVEPTDDARTQLVPPGFVRSASSEYVSAHVRCR